MTGPPPLSPAASQYLRKLVFDGSAIVLDERKDYLLQARLASLLDREQCQSWEALVEKLKPPGAALLRRRVIEAMTTHETSFFRDFHPFEALRKHVLPAIAADRTHAPTLNIWSAAASSGQEIYSIAMLCRQLSPKFPGWNMRLLATDLSEEILSRAREGKYSQLEVNRGLPAMLLAQHFVRVGLDWQLKPDVRSMVDFRVLNLIGIWPPLPEMDVVFLRNVLIYFDLETKRAILDRVASTMRRGGLLFLGGVETTLNLCGRFREEAFDKSVAYRLIA